MRLLPRARRNGARGRWLLGGALAVVLLAAGAFAAEAVREAVLAAHVDAGAERIIAMAGIAATMPLDEQVDRLRTFVNRNSIHEIDDEFYSYWRDLPQVIARMTAFAQGLGPPPHLECSSRSELMQAVLPRLGHDTRAIVLYDHAEGFPSHTFIEVRDTATGRWQIQDPDYDLYWTHLASGRRASIYDLLASPLTGFAPCNGIHCDWSLVSWEGKAAAKLRRYFGLASVVDRERGVRPLLVNTTRFDLAQPQLVEGATRTFCQWAGKNCRQEILRFVDAAP
jgi:hypothetical protein